MANNEDTLHLAVDELYAADPEDFLQRRSALSAAAKKAGDTATAKAIAALRKPTRSAYTLNRLARSETGGVAELLDLGSQLRDAERSVDAKQIRELTTRRRRLVDELTRRAFDLVAESAPSSALRDEVVSTLTAALADGDVADQLADGILVKPARWEGFGFGAGPDLTLVPTPAPRSGGDRATPTSRAATRSDSTPAQRRAADADEKERARQAAEAAKQARLEDARRAAEDAEEAVILATDEEQIRVGRLRELEEQIADARRLVDEARVQLRRAEIRQRRADDALRRLER